jgi:hypothetical protein
LRRGKDQKTAGMVLHLISNLNENHRLKTIQGSVVNVIDTMPCLSFHDEYPLGTAAIDACCVVCYPELLECH